MSALLSKKYTPFIIGIFLIILYYIPISIIGDNWFVIIHDNLDSSIANIKMLKDNNLVFDYSSGEPIIGPVTRNAFRSPWDITILWYTFLPLFWGIVVNNFLSRIIAYIGMYLLLSRYVIKEGQYKYLIATVASLCFAFIPFYSDYGISSMGIPLIAYALLNLKNGIRIASSFIYILIFGFYSNLLLSGAFIGLIGGFYFLYLIFRDKKTHWLLLIGLVFLGAIYISTNIYLISDFFSGQMQTMHRSEFQTSESPTLIIINHIKLFFVTQYHTGILLTLPIVLLLTLQFFVTKTLDRTSLILLISIGLIILISFCDHLALAFAPRGHLIQQFQFDRFYFFLPCIWIVLLAQITNVIIDYHYGLSLFLCTSIIIIALDFGANKEYVSIAKKYVLHKQTEPTYRQFFDEELFAQIDSYIAKPKNNYKVASIGMYPSVAQYNGFNCIDGYWNTYPLKYKHEFRKIIAKELEKNEHIKSYFDNWGSRCYVFSSELGQKYLYDKNCGMEIQSLAVNTQQMLDMNCQYVFSAVPIKNYENLGWKFEKSFTTKKSWWEIYLYSIPAIHK